ncbi:MAG: hypothetical protein Q8R92_11810 [Deltaproteobacteria bacterium]|nr:hypothetical protein [Deltaproteobacteria bacterium]
MAEVKVRRCMVCAKEYEMAGSICETCNAKIRGEAAGKKEGLRKEAEREIKRAGVSTETHKPEKK